MIADWTVEIGSESPHIVVPWEGWMDLSGLSCVEASTSGHVPLEEAVGYPELQPLLILANRAPTLTSKVDVFPVNRDEVDPEIAEAGTVATAHGLASYLDILVAEALSFPACEQIARAAVQGLAALPMPLACAEIVVRPARLYDQDTFGFTLYAMGFGPDAEAARACWIRAARASVEALRQAVDAQTRASSSIG